MRVLLLLGLLGLGAQAQLSMFLDRIKEVREIQKMSINPVLIDAIKPHSLISKIQIGGANVSEECALDISIFIESAMAIYNDVEKILLGAGGAINLTDFDRNVLIPALDACAKPGPGILRGHLSFSGQFRECHNIHYTPEGRTRAYKMVYSRIYIDTQFRPNTAKGACTGKMIGLDLCLPNACTLQEYESLFSQINIDAIGGNPFCEYVNIDSHLETTDAGSWIVYCLMGGILILCVLSGFVDYFVSDLVKGAPFTKGLGWKLFMAFSCYTNISEIYSTANSKKAGQISPIHCIRFFSISWVMIGHSMMLLLSYCTNPLDALDEIQNVPTQFIMNAFFSVDSFFFLSGLLLGFIWFKSYYKNKRGTMSAQSWVMFYVHRILRLSPPYFILIAFWTFVFQTWLKNMPQIMYLHEEHGCHKHWWIDFLYLQDYVNYKNECYGISWYLATDMQIFLFSPIILVPMAVKPVFGLIVSGVVLTLSTAANIVTMYHFDFPPTYDPLEWVLGRGDINKYSFYMYYAPYTRCQVYIIGILVGYLLQAKKKMRINHIVNIGMWALSFTMMLLLILGNYNYSKGINIPIFWRAMYSAFSKPAWGLSLSWIIVSCFYGYGGPINTFMSWNIFVPLGRLSYCAYLIHICIITYIIGMNEGELFYSSFSATIANYAIPVIVLTFLFATIWSAAFEISLGKVEMLMFGGLRNSRPPKPAVAPSAPVVPPTVVEGGESGGKKEGGENWSS